MAYCRFDVAAHAMPAGATTGPCHDAVPSPRATARAQAGFTRREWQVIALASADGLASLRPPGPIARLSRALFGIAPPPPLADRHLESLRRVAVQVWHHGARLPAEEVARFLAEGFTPAQLEAAVTLVGSARAGR